MGVRTYVRSVWGGKGSRATDAILGLVNVTTAGMGGLSISLWVETCMMISASLHVIMRLRFN